jgi:hypothetical protein
MPFATSQEPLKSKCTELLADSELLCFLAACAHFTAIVSHEEKNTEIRNSKEHRGCYFIANL